MRRPITALVAALAVFAVAAAGASAFGIITDDPPPPGIVGTPYKYVFQPKAGAPPYAFWLDGGELPPGLKIASDGTMSGTPTAPGYYVFVVGASQCCGPDSQWGFNVTIRDRVAITTPSLASAILGAPYTATLSVTGTGGLGMGWSIVSGSLPPGLTLAPNGSPGDGTISGTPTTSGTYSFSVRVADTDGFVPSRAVTRAYTINVVAPLTVNAAASTPPTGIVGKRYTASIATASGGVAPYAWSVGAGNAPPGLTVDAAGNLTGTPTTAGTFAFTVVATDAEGRTASTPASVTVVGKLDVTTTRLRNGRVGKAYRTKLRSTGGAAPIRWKVTKGKLPAGLRLGTATGILGGTPRSAGTSKLTVTATDALGQKSSERLSIEIRA